MEKQRSGRGWLIALSIIVGLVLSCAILPLGGFALLLAAVGDTSASEGPLTAGRWQEEIISGSGVDRIVVIYVNGTIGASSDPFSSAISHDELLSQIKQAASDPLVRAVVLRVESPGGGVVASSEIHAELTKLQAADKILVVSMGSTAASGGYYISAPADKIYANKDTFTGSLGVILSLTNYGQAFDTLGLKSYVYKSGALKDIGSPLREPTSEENIVLQTIVDQAYQGFVDVIVAGRELPRERVLEIADGRIYTGAQALELDLIDEIGNLDEAIAGSKELTGLSEALVVSYTQNESLRSLLFSRLAAPQVQTDPLGLQAITDPPTPQLEYRWRP